MTILIYFVVVESQSAVQVLERIQGTLAEDGGPDDELSSLIHILHSPLFTQLLRIQDSLGQLKEVRTIFLNDKFKYIFHEKKTHIKSH